MHGNQGILALWFLNDFEWCVWSSIWSSLSLVWPTENHARAHVWSSIRFGHGLVWPTTNRTALRYCMNIIQCAIEQGKGKGKGKGKSASALAKRIFYVFFRYFQITQSCCTTPRIVHRCTGLVHTLVTFLSSYTSCDWSIFLKKCW